MNTTASGAESLAGTPAADPVRACYLSGRAEHLLPGLAADSVHSVVTDPPYGLAAHKTATIVKALEAWLGGDRSHVPDGKGFMSRDWDAFVPPPALWDECYRILKPGGYLLAFAAPRTADLMGLSIRLAGFEIQDSLHWLYGSGWPKAKSRLKPAHEPILMCRKPAKSSPPLPGLDGCMVATGDSLNGGAYAKNGRDRHDGAENWRFKRLGGAGAYEQPDGRYPPNLLLTHAADCNGSCAPGCPVAEIDAQSGSVGAAAPVLGTEPSMAVEDGGVYNGRQRARGAFHADTGGASRFFPVTSWDPVTDVPFLYQAKAPKSERPRLPDGTTWPAVKPLALMRWILRLVTPPGGTLADPCAGTGTTVQAALLEGFRCVAMDDDPVAVQLAHVRLDGLGEVRFG